MDGVYSYMQEFVNNAKGEYIENGYTKHKNINYARQRITDRQREIIGDEPLVYDITELMELFLKKQAN